MKFLQDLRPTKQNFSFLLTLFSVIGFFALAWGKNTDVSMVIPGILGLYFGSKSAEKINAQFQARMDPNANTAEVIQKLEELH